MPRIPEDLNLSEVENAVRGLVGLERATTEKGSVRHRIDVLERALELLRIRHRHLANEVPFEEFIQGSLHADQGVLHYTPPERRENLGYGTRPARLQANLLLFLLLHHGRLYHVHDIISGFIDMIWDELDVLDFKRTQTGVIRCFTNTRFAANVLRKYGFLKFTRREAYKTWVLSLPGFLVASNVLDRKPWELPEDGLKDKFELHRDIYDARLELREFDDFVALLERVCRPNVDVFSTFAGVLRRAHVSLRQYWHVLEDQTLTQRERRLESMRRLGALEASPGMDDFYNEFSRCIDVDRLLRDLDQG